MKEKKRKIFTGFIIFLGIMWLCTLISRAVYAYQLPMVTVQKPDSKYVEHKVEAEGIVVAGGEIPVNFVSGLRLSGISVREGDRAVSYTHLTLPTNREVTEWRKEIFSLRLT